MKTWQVVLRELPIKSRNGGIRIEYACTGGCLSGYAWSASAHEDTLVRAAAEALRVEHDAYHAKLAEGEEEPVDDARQLG